MRLKYFPLYLLISVASACAEQKDEWTNVPAFSKQFQEAVQTVGRNPGDYKIIDLAKTTTFAWDSLYYFYDDSDNNTGDVIAHVTGCSWNGPAFRDDCMRLVFTHKGRVNAFVDYIDRNKSRAGYVPLPLRIMFDRRSGLICAHDSARLTIIRSCDTQYLMREKVAERNRKHIVENCPEAVRN